MSKKPIIIIDDDDDDLDTIKEAFKQLKIENEIFTLDLITNKFPPGFLLQP